MLELQPLLKHLSRWGWLIVLCAIVAGGVGLLVSMQLPPLYRATTTVLVSERGSGAATERPTTRNELLVETYLQLLHREPILEALIVRLELPLRPETLARRLQAQAVPNTQMLTISAQANSAELAALMANTAAAELSAQGPQLIGSLWRRTTLSVVAPATPPIRPIFPRTPLNVAIAALLGGLTATGLIMLRRVMLKTVETPDDLFEAGGLEPLGSIPAAGRLRVGRLPITLEQPLAPAAEEYRKLRAALIPHMPADAPWALAVTSAAYAEGKSAVAANLAVSLAQTGRRVLLVDANLRRPMLHSLFGAAHPGELGLATALQRGSAGLDDYLQPTALPQLLLLPAGGQPALPTELLGSPELRTLIAALKDRAQIVILDCGPALTVSDGLEAARACDAMLLTTRFGVSRTADLAQLRRLIAQTGTPVIGGVVTCAPGGTRIRAERPARRHSVEAVPASRAVEPEPQTVGD